MVEPTITSPGNTYEKTAIEAHVRLRGNDFLTGEKIKLDNLAPNLALKNSIQEFLAENPWAFDHVEGDNIDRLVF
jgi:hypothetical protein